MRDPGFGEERRALALCSVNGRGTAAHPDADGAEIGNVRPKRWKVEWSIRISGSDIMAAPVDFDGAWSGWNRSARRCIGLFGERSQFRGLGRGFSRVRRAA